MPWGFGNVLLWKRRRNVWAVICCSSLLPLLIEVSQLFIERSVDVDDFILNFTGSCLGAVLFFLLKKRFWREWQWLPLVTVHSAHSNWCTQNAKVVNRLWTGALAHSNLGFVMQKTHENALRWHRVNSDYPFARCRKMWKKVLTKVLISFIILTISYSSDWWRKAMTRRSNTWWSIQKAAVWWEAHGKLCVNTSLSFAPNVCED